MSAILKNMLRIFGLAAFALLSFIVLVYLATIFFANLGQGIGSRMMSSAPSPSGTSYLYVSGQKDSKNRLLYLTIEGVILGSAPSYIGSTLGIPGVTFGYGVQDVLQEAARDPSVRGVLLHMQTPGGTIYGSSAIFDGVKAYQQATGRPVLAYIEGLSASGGVMAMVGANGVYADRGSLIGSIGILGPNWLYYNKPVATQGGILGGGVSTQDGIERTIVYAGRGKDLGNPYRRATPEELKVLQNGVDIEYAAFVKHVAENRKIDENRIRDEMGAQIFDNKTAQEYGLIDGTLNRDDSIRKLAELAGVGQDFQLVRPRIDRGGFFGRLFGLADRSLLNEVAVKDVLQHEICDASLQTPLAYHGNIDRLCN